MKTNKSVSIEIYLCLFIFSGLALSFAGHGTFVDENLIIQTVESLVEHGELTVTKMFQALEGPDGKYYSRYGIAFPLALTPFYLIGELLDWFFPETKAFFGNANFFMMLWGNLLFTVLTGWLFYRICRLLEAGARLSVLLALALIFSTPYWPYSQTLYRLTASSALLLGALYLILLYLKSPKKNLLFYLVALTAVGLNLREDLVLALMAMGLYVLFYGKSPSRWWCAASLIIGAILGCLIWAGHNWIRFGAFFVENYSDLSFNSSLIITCPELLFGLRRGIIVYTPLSLILVISFYTARKCGRMGLWLLCCFIILVYLLLYSKSSMWHGGLCWGPRHMYFLLPFCLLPGIWLWKNGVSSISKIFLFMAIGIGMMVNWPGVYAHQGRYQDFFSSPSIFPLILKPVVHPDYITYEELDLWWIRIIKMNPMSLWPIVFMAMIALLIWSGMKLWKSLAAEDNRIERFSN